MKTKFTILMLVLLGINVKAQAPNYQWAKGAGSSSIDIGKSIATDPNGNVYVTGFFNPPSITFGSTILTNHNSSNGGNVFVVKYGPSGNVIWAKSAGGTDNSSDNGRGIAVDAGGNVYVTGSFQNSTITFDTTTLTNVSPSNEDIFTVKYDPAGNVLWAKNAGGGGGDIGSGIAVDVNGNAFVSGYFWSSSLTAGSFTLNGVGGADALLIKYDASGNELWAKSAGNNFDDRAFRVGVDNNGNATIAGSFNSSTITFGSSTLTNANAGTGDIFVTQFDANGNTNWAKAAGGTNQDLGYAISVDPNGNVLVTGEFWSSSIIFGTTTLTNTNNGTGDIFVVKYDLNGNETWAVEAGGANQDQAFGISTDASGNVFITGYYDSPSITFGSTTLNASNLFIVKYNPTGSVVWANEASGTAAGNDICSDAGGNVAVTGYTYGSTVTFGTFALSPVGFNDVFVAKLGTITGIAEDATKNATYSYPNPSTGVFTVMSGETISKIEIMNLLGEVVFYSEVNSESPVIDLSSQAKGVYFIRINSNKEIKSEKIIIQ